MININENEIVFIPRKKSIRDNFVLGFSMLDTLIIATTGILAYLLVNCLGRAEAYQAAIISVIISGALLCEVPTTQLRFITIIHKIIRFKYSQKDYYLDSRLKKGNDVL